MKRLVCYSLAIPVTEPRPDLLKQLETSIRSIRASNHSIPICVFAYGNVASELVPLLKPYGVSVHQQGSYEDRLMGLLPAGWQALSGYPLLHKFFNFREIAAFSPEQVLLLDCDTLVARDINLLFTRYQKADCYAREDVGCGRSPHSDPQYLNEDTLARIATGEQIRAVPPFNSGAVLLNNRVWQRLPELDALLASYAWRFLIWMALNPVPAAAPYGEARGAEYLRRRVNRPLIAAETSRALEFPSANRWILEQVALWMTLGHIRNFTYGDFSERSVPYYHELLSGKSHGWALCHYFRHNQTAIEMWLQRSSAAKRTMPSACRRATRRWSAPQVTRPASAIPEAILRSPIVARAGGFAIYSGLLDDSSFARLRDEAKVAYSTAKPQEWWGSDRDNEDDTDLAADRRARPRRRFLMSGGGPIQAVMCQSTTLSRFLSSECGLTIRPTSSRGSFSYYTRAGDFLDLHRDLESCDVAVITVLHDNSSPMTRSGALVLYSSRIGESLSAVRARPDIGAQTIKVSTGQTLVMFGGIVPHRVLPVVEGQSRVISVLCFRAFPPNVSHSRRRK